MNVGDLNDTKICTHLETLREKSDASSFKRSGMGIEKVILPNDKNRREHLRDPAIHAGCPRKSRTENIPIHSVCQFGSTEQGEQKETNGKQSILS
jgi:hypothetical protein